jgi:hypothetical protein
MASIEWPREIRQLLVRTLVMAGMMLLILIPFLVAYGPDCLGFVQYHRERGLEIGSVWGSVLLALEPLIPSARIDYSYGSINLSSPQASQVAHVAPWVGGALLLGVTVLLVIRMRHISLESPPQEGTTLAQCYPAEFATYALLLLMIFVCTNKVFSPQYFLWLVPLVTLVSLRDRPRRLFLSCFVLTCLLTAVLFPFLFVIDLIDTSVHEALQPAFRTPTHRFIALLLLRNLLFLGLTGALALHLGRLAFARCPERTS